MGWIMERIQRVQDALSNITSRKNATCDAPKTMKSENDPTVYSKFIDGDEYINGMKVIKRLDGGLVVVENEAGQQNLFRLATEELPSQSAEPDLLLSKLDKKGKAIDDDCVSCKVIGSVVPPAAGLYTLWFWRKKVPGMKGYNKICYTGLCFSMIALSISIGVCRMFDLGPFKKDFEPTRENILDSVKSDLNQIKSFVNRKTD
ncbi:unnamed protein product [Owenia fusiformis]|uniref:Uncharacterized protein n=1 Tax=Owenia fusiformis TaxID=6347 RepID=A0A8J1XWZ9_OWEFU|nr:unnamed protein product [Owenia fusiformis]